MAYKCHELSHAPVAPDLAGVTGDAERTNDKRQTCRRLGSGVLDAQMKKHNSLVTSFLYYSLLLLHFFSLFFKTLLLKSFFPVL
jgi:hypothetical protein